MGKGVILLRTNGFNPPCKNCADRHIGCHSECELYKIYKDKSSLTVEAERKEHITGEYAYTKNLRRKVK